MKKFSLLFAFVVGGLIFAEFVAHILLDAPVNQGIQYYSPAGLRLKPGRSGYRATNPISGLPTHINTNSLGLRGPEPTNGNSIRIMFLGDSITGQDYLEEENTWVKLTETKLRKANFDVTSLNAGISGTGLASQIDLLSNTIEKAKPKLVILGFYLDDATSCCSLPEVRLPGLTAHSRLLNYVVQTFNLLMGRVQHFKNDMTAEQLNTALAEFRKMHPSLINPTQDEQSNFYATVDKNFQFWGNSFSPATWTYLEQHFSELIKLCKKSGTAIGIVMFPVTAQLTTKEVFDFPQEQIQRIASREGVPFLDLLPKFRALSIKDEHELYYDHCHPNMKGNNYIQEWVAQFILENFGKILKTSTNS